MTRIANREALLSTKQASTIPKAAGGIGALLCPLRSCSVNGTGFLAVVNDGGLPSRYFEHSLRDHFARRTSFLRNSDWVIPMHQHAMTAINNM